LESLVGKGIFEDIIHVAPFASKKDCLGDIGADVLVDDGASNTTHALELGINGIWFMCPENAHIYKQVISEDNNGREWMLPFDAELLRNKALIANDWEDVLEIIRGL
jgi:hypothetical protein